MAPNSPLRHPPTPLQPSNIKHQTQPPTITHHQSSITLLDLKSALAIRPTYRVGRDIAAANALSIMIIKLRPLST